jgi:hypothetical protein
MVRWMSSAFTFAAPRPGLSAASALAPRGLLLLLRLART